MVPFSENFRTRMLTHRKSGPPGQVPKSTCYVTLGASVLHVLQENAGRTVV